MSAVVCPACGAGMLLYRNKSGKPYATCRPCGAQFFIRNPAGVAVFATRHPEEWRKAPVMGGAPEHPRAEEVEELEVVAPVEDKTKVKPTTPPAGKKGSGRATFFG